MCACVTSNGSNQMPKGNESRKRSIAPHQLPMRNPFSLLLLSLLAQSLQAALPTAAALPNFVTILAGAYVGRASSVARACYDRGQDFSYVCHPMVRAPSCNLTCRHWSCCGFLLSGAAAGPRQTISATTTAAQQATRTSLRRHSTTSSTRPGSISDATMVSRGFNAMSVRLVGGNWWAAEPGHNVCLNIFLLA